MNHNAFAIYHTWPDMRNAEYEVLQRVLSAASRIGKSAVVIDNSGNIIWSSPELMLRKGSALDPNQVEFAISLHFESPRVCDVYTYYALWQPVEFYADFGYRLSVDKFSTHNDLLSCHSDIADNHALNIFSGMGRPIAEPLPTLFHTLPEPFLAPNIDKDSTLFYVGINWERIGRPKGRYHDLLKKLDERGMVKIYGPEEIQGVAPWEGFQTYSGELPFDGTSMRSAINDCGICLALSSKAHQNSGIMSNRLFEGLASGAVVIANPNALIAKYFSDVVYVVDDSRGEAHLEQQILTCLRDIRRDPEAARQRVLQGQEILRQVCSMERSLETLFTETNRRKSGFIEKFLQKAELTAIFVAQRGDKAEIEEHIRQLSSQMLCEIDLHVIVDPDFLHDIGIDAKGSVRSLTLHAFKFEGSSKEFDGIKEAPTAIGSLLSSILNTVQTPYFAILKQTDLIFRDHFASLAKALESTSDAACAVSGSLVRSHDAMGKEKRGLHELRVPDAEEFVTANGKMASGRMLFRSSLIKSGYAPLMKLLDGEEHHLFALAAMIDGPFAQTGYASHTHDETAVISIREPAFSRDLQRQFIKDYFNGDARWIARASRNDAVTALPSRSPKDPPLRWETYHSREIDAKRLELNRTIPVLAGAKGIDYLVAGFSQPESEAVWLAEGRGVIEFSLPRHAAQHIEDYRIVLGLCGRRSAVTGRMQHCTFVLNNIAVAYDIIPDFFTNFSIKVPINILKDTNTFRLELVPDHKEVVLDQVGNVIDGRTLSLLINSIAVFRNALEGLPLVKVGKTYEVTEGEEMTKALSSGFYGPERSQTWMCGTYGEIQFRTKELPNDPVIHMKMAGRPSNEDGHLQEVHISMNGRELQSFKMSHGMKDYYIPCLVSDLSDVTRISIRAAHAEPVLDAAGSIVDPRFLGVSLFGFGLKDKTALGTLQPQSKNQLKAFGKALKRIVTREA